MMAYGPPVSPTASWSYVSIYSATTGMTGTTTTDDYLYVTRADAWTPLVFTLPPKNWRWFRDIEPDPLPPVVALPLHAFRPIRPQHRCDHGQRRRHIRKRFVQRLRTRIPRTTRLIRAADGNISHHKD